MSAKTGGGLATKWKLRRFVNFCSSIEFEALVNERAGNGGSGSGTANESNRRVRKGGRNPRRHRQGLAKVNRIDWTYSKTPSSRGLDAEILATQSVTIRRQNVQSVIMHMQLLDMSRPTPDMAYTTTYDYVITRLPNEGASVGSNRRSTLPGSPPRRVGGCGLGARTTRSRKPHLPVAVTPKQN